MTSQAHVLLQPGDPGLDDRIDATDPVAAVRIAPGNGVAHPEQRMRWQRRRLHGRRISLVASLAARPLKQVWSCENFLYSFKAGLRPGGHGTAVRPVLAPLRSGRSSAKLAHLFGASHFHRIEAISRVDGKLRVLDFKLADVRVKVLDEPDARFANDQASVAY